MGVGVYLEISYRLSSGRSNKRRLFVAIAFVRILFFLKDVHYNSLCPGFLFMFTFLRDTETIGDRRAENRCFIKIGKKK